MKYYFYIKCNCATHDLTGYAYKLVAETDLHIFLVNYKVLQGVANFIGH